MRKKWKREAALLLAAAVSVCGSINIAAAENETAAESVSTELSEAETDERIELGDLIFDTRQELSYAEEFDVYFNQDGYKLIDVHDSAQYLIVPEGGELPEGLDENIRILQQPLDTIYMAATSPMDLFDALDSVGNIRMSGTDADGWYVQAAADALNSGDMLYAGKYDEPDYELLISEDCDLAIESTMILHAPKVQEMIEMLDIPVFIDRSSYESHPLGRTEWIKAYAAMVNKEEQAQEFFSEQAAIIDQLADFQNTEKTIAFFYINTNGVPVVRNTTDYISSMIEIAGGRNAFADLAQETDKTSVEITMEEFYSTASDADYLIYNSSIDGTVGSLSDLIAKDELIADFRAVQDGNVWITDPSMYQSTGTIGELIRDINRMLTGGDSAEMTFLRPLQ